MTPRRLLGPAADRLAAAGIGSARVDAELLLAHCLGVPRSRLALVESVSAQQAARFEELVLRRAGREPLQHIVGQAAFRHVELAVGPGVFVPRPETELLVDAVLPLLGTLANPLVVDLCAGSGALALAVADEVPTARVHAVERSVGALAWLRRNAHGTRVQVTASDVAAPDLLAGLRGQVDVVLSNPPYVPSTTAVEPEVRADPGEAVFAGPDGLGLLPIVISVAATLLRPGGMLAVEHDDSHQDAVVSLLERDGRWTRVADHRDLAGRPRYATAQRSVV